MDKYQRYLAGKIHVGYFDENGVPIRETFYPSGAMYSKPQSRVLNVYNDCKISVKQDFDITKTKYMLYVSGPVINRVWLIKNDREAEIYGSNDDVESVRISRQQVRLESAEPVAVKRQGLFGRRDTFQQPLDSKNTVPTDTVTENQKMPPEKRAETYYRVDIDFDDKVRVSGIKIAFVNNLADPIVIPVSYIDADKDKYYAEKEREHKDMLNKNVNVSCKTGASLVNIYFNSCGPEYASSLIELYIGEDRGTNWRKIKECKVRPGDFYVSIGGLAYGKYSFILRQYDKSGKSIYESDRMQFTISMPYGGGRPVNVIS